jgi:hypothetical protein
MIFDISKIKQQDVPSAFLDLIQTGDVADVEPVLNNPNVKQHIGVDCMFLGLISAASLRDLSVFNIIHDHLKQDKIEIPDIVLDKLFNSLCLSKSLKNLKHLDKSFKLSESMMTNESNIDDNAIITGDLLNYYANMYPIYATRKEELSNSWNTHGLISASKDGNSRLVEYLLSIPVDIPNKLVEASFISAIDEFQFDTAMIAYSKLKSIGDSEFIKKFSDYIIDEKKANFISKLILKEEIENELSPSNSKDKKNKL